MRLVADSGLWTTGQRCRRLMPLTRCWRSAARCCPGPSTTRRAVAAHHVHRCGTRGLAVAGPRRSGHSAIVARWRQTRRPGSWNSRPRSRTGSLDPLRRLALGHWLRRWWPASQRDGIADLDSALLDAEIALLTAAAEDFFTDDTFDFGRRRAAASACRSAQCALTQQGDPRVLDSCARAPSLPRTSASPFGGSVSRARAGRRSDYALAAGPRRRARACARRSSPGGLARLECRAARHLRCGRGHRRLAHRSRRSGSHRGGAYRGFGSRFRLPESPCVSSAGPITGVGRLDAAGTATVELFDEDAGPATEFRAWNHDWRDTQVTVGAPTSTSRSQARDRVRAFARARLRQPAGDAFLAEVLAAESDY